MRFVIVHNIYCILTQRFVIVGGEETLAASLSIFLFPKNSKKKFQKMPQKLFQIYHNSPISQSLPHLHPVSLCVKKVARWFRKPAEAIKVKNLVKAFLSMNEGPRSIKHEFRSYKGEFGMERVDFSVSRINL